MLKSTFRFALLLVFASMLFAQGSSGSAGIKPLSVVKQPGGQLATGQYSCKAQYGGSMSWKLVNLTSATTYEYKASKVIPGSMHYDAKTGTIEFVDGPLGKNFRAMYGRRDDGHPIFVLVDTELQPKAVAYDYCALRTK